MLSPPLASGKMMEKGVDPEALGKGDWIHIIGDATNGMGGVIPSVTNMMSMMEFYKKMGFDYLAVKAGTGARIFPNAEMPQFTPDLVNEAHDAGLKIFAYTRSLGTDVPGEIELAKQMLDMGADGFIIDAEVEWEPHILGTNGADLAIQLCQGIKAAYPNRFLGHCPLPIISYHKTFPYKEFGRYCDAVMPQAYWATMKLSPARMVEWMEQEWKAFHASLTGDWTNAIKPLAPIAQAWDPKPRVMKAKEIIQFVNILKKLPNPASPGGYKSVSFWKCELHTGKMWRAMKQIDILKPGLIPMELAVVEEIPDTAEPETEEIVVDNSDPQVVYEGTWFEGEMESGYYGDGYRFAVTASGQPTASVTFPVSVPKTGAYDVYVWHPSSMNRTSASQWNIPVNGTNQTLKVDQTMKGGQWFLLAAGIHFDETASHAVKVSNLVEERAGATLVAADAIRLLPAGTSEKSAETDQTTSDTSARPATDVTQ